MSYNNNSNNEHPLNMGRIMGILFGFLFWWPVGLYMLIKTIKEVDEYEQTMAKIRRESSSGSYSSTNDSKRQNANEIKFTVESTPKKQSKGWSLKLKQTLFNIFGGIFSLAGIGAFIDILSYGIDFGTLFSGGLFFGGGLGMLFYANEIKKKLKRYKKYSAVIGDADSMSVATIAAKIPTTFDKACKDLEDMIDEGYFGNGAYLDMRTNKFVRNAKVAEQEDLRFEEDPVEEFTNSYQEIIAQIKQLNDDIVNMEVSGKISQIEDITKKIFNVLDEKPEKKNILRTFLNYYLPTTLKLLDDYRRLESQGNKGETVKKAMNQINGILDTLVIAFEQQLDAMFEEDVLDISSEISALESMMAQDFAINSDPFKQKDAQTKLKSDGTKE